MCKIPDTVTNSEVDSLQEKIREHIDDALRYGCESWYKHLVGAHKGPAHAPKITSVLHQFLEERFLFWLEVLSVLCTISVTIFTFSLIFF